jgi:multidrug resistance efflux pump
MRALVQFGATALCAAALIAFAAPAPARADLKAAMAESNLEKRSKLALENASAALKAARQAYDSGDAGQTAARAAEVKESVELCYASLKATGKNPRKSPKWFKQAEIATRDLLRRLDTFQQEMGYMDRPMLDSVKAAVQQVHDDLLVGLMEGQRK